MTLKSDLWQLDIRVLESHPENQDFLARLYHADSENHLSFQRHRGTDILFSFWDNYDIYTYNTNTNTQ